MIMRTGVDHLDDSVLAGAAILIVSESSFRDRAVWVAFHGHALAAVLLHATGGGDVQLPVVSVP